MSVSSMLDTRAVGGGDDDEDGGESSCCREYCKWEVRKMHNRGPPYMMSGLDGILGHRKADVVEGRLREFLYIYFRSSRCHVFGRV